MPNGIAERATEQLHQRITELEQENAALRQQLDTPEQSGPMLRQHAWLYRELLTNLPDSTVFLFDRHFRYVLGAGAIAPLNNQPGTEPDASFALEGQSFPSSDLEHLAPMYRAALDGHATTAEVVFSNRIYTVHAFPVRDDQGVIVASMVIAQDITERRRSQEDLLRINNRLSQMVAELEEHTREVIQVSELGELLQSCLTVDEVYGTVARVCPRLFVNQSGALYVLDDRRQLALAASWGDQPDHLSTFPVDVCWALRRGRPYLAENDTIGLCRYRQKTLAVPYLCIPLMAQGRSLGILRLGNQATEAFQNSEHWQRLGELVASQLRLALINVQLYEKMQPPPRPARPDVR